MSGFFERDDPARPRRAGLTASRRPRVLIGTAVVLVLAFFCVSVFDGIWTERLWFSSVGYSQVFSKVLGTRVLLFVVFAVLMGAFVSLNIVLAFRFRPLFRPASTEQAGLDRYRSAVLPLRRWLVIGVGVVVAIFAGASGASQWRQFLLWRHQVPFGKTDPFFGKDIGYFVFTLPWLHYLVNFGMAATFLGLVAAAVVHYLFGGIRLQAKRDKLSGAAQAQISGLLGLFVLFKSADYWLDRYDLDTSNGLFTGMSYTDYHAVLPSKNILTFIALICAVLFFANVLRRTWMLPTIGLGLLALSAILLGALWPGIVQQFQVSPSEADKEASYLAKNIASTRQAYDVADAKVIPYNAKLDLSPAQLQGNASWISEVRLMDPSLESRTFDQLQQVRGYYGVAPVLDVDRYKIDGRLRDLVIATRELNQSGLPPQQRNWANLHTVYTHGFGVIAAFGNQRNAQDQPVNNSGEPIWAEQDLPPRGYLSRLSPNGFQPRIYFGQHSPSYSIVGKVPGGRSVELDMPEQAAAGGAPKTNTYTGSAGVHVGGLFNKLLYAIKFGEPNIVLSSRVNADSKILYIRNPRQRLEQVAPWLTVDSDPYPAVVNGRVDWILDGYTTTDRYPMSQQRSLRDMTSDSLNPRTSYATLPSDQINYMRNSVKAVVDAYSGKVTLYRWDKDPIMRAWSNAFPGVVKPKKDIPPALRAHMRYPEDLFKVQRNILAQYHVTNPRSFYGATDLWKVPQDPENKAKNQPPYRLSVIMPGTGSKPVFSLTSVFVPQKRQNLASFIAVDSEASSPDYGKIRILRLPGNKQIPGPSQIANAFAADPAIQKALLPYQKSSKVLYGNLLTLPVGGGLLYVQPVFTLRQTGAGSYPVLRYVLASFGQNAGYGTTLNAALDDVLGTNAFSGGSASPGQGAGGPSGPGTSTGASATVKSLLERAQAKFTAAQAALKRGDLSTYAADEAAGRRLVAKALQAANVGKKPQPSGPAGQPSGSPKGQPTGAPKASPSANPTASSGQGG